MTTDGLPNVSRETNERLSHYIYLLRKWNPSINLVAKSTIQSAWTRHIVDSAQVFDMAEGPVAHWADLGSGGGFPGLVIAIMAMDVGSPRKVSLVESDARKCAFLRTVIRETGAKADVVNARIEEVEPLGADVLSARALADLSSLLGFAERHMTPEGVALFPKGENWQKEVQAAQSKWRFDYQFVKSETETGPVILRITGVSRV
ncbi:MULTISPECIES: 16S rRNA (guanine(527)-N(7))-methyltransferase RsmG [unclassified Roseovarius]|uniref:16S rRNA (guanine(527)-N(7))-methyltransferase RsmG n=1 Tax=unclassified Roseovarius TaxID=2614913 RepID=UPI00273F3754|nr:MULTISPECIES: 16S rRNA (guanine(527)-N(7))-methyltransferase RsmG [unclassified Roseovarius]